MKKFMRYFIMTLALIGFVVIVATYIVALYDMGDTSKLFTIATIVLLCTFCMTIAYNFGAYEAVAGSDAEEIEHMKDEYYYEEDEHLFVGSNMRVNK